MLFSGGVRGGGVFFCARGRPGAAPGRPMADFLQSNTPGARAGAVDDLKLGTQKLQLQLSLGMRVVLCLVYILVQHGGERSDIIERRIL